MIVPSIDIMDGKVVQLKNGKELMLELDNDPVELARRLNRIGEICVIDLDAALGKGSNKELIKKICKVADVRVGGGIREEALGIEYLKAGAKKLIFGTAASPELLGRFKPDSCMVALDNVDGEVLDKGWTEGTGESIEARSTRLAPYCDSFLMTFVKSEGTLEGLPKEAIEKFAGGLSKAVTVAGGANCAEEIIELNERSIDVQVGMAMYTGMIDPVQIAIDCLRFPDNGLLPTIVQDEEGEVLMLAYSTRESLERAMKEGKGIYYSRSRKEIWVKGATSGNTQELISVRSDCDRDAIIFKVKQAGPACHRETYTCFRNSTQAPFSMGELFQTLKERKETLPEGSYSASLFKDRSLLLAKIEEESQEVLNYESKDNLRHEIADLLYFVSTLAVDEGLDWTDIVNELRGRNR